jgi:hypothetical protein
MKNNTINTRRARVTPILPLSLSESKIDMGDTFAGYVKMDLVGLFSGQDDLNLQADSIVYEPSGIKKDFLFMGMGIG